MATDSLPSPCISICRIDPLSGYCEGCYRSRDEIKAWRQLPPLEQRRLLDTLHDRRTDATGRNRRQRRRRA